MVATIFAMTVVSLAVTLVAYGAAFRKLREPIDCSEHTEGVSIVKPLKGDDDELYENLSAFAQLEHPNYEILFGAEDATDEALAIARRVQRENPDKRIEVLFGALPRGLNPKVRLVRRLARRARHDWILVSDSNVRPRRDYLASITGLQKRTGASLVHNVLAGVGERSIGAVLENLHMNSWVVGAVTMADAGGHSCVIGKSMLMRRSDLGKLDAFSKVEDLLAEDYVLGALFEKNGHRVVLSPHVLPVMSSHRSMATFLNRHVRWGQLRRRINATCFFGEVTLNPTPFLLLLASVGTVWFQLWAVCGIALKVALDAQLGRRLRGEPYRLSQLAWIPVKDVLALGMWAVSAVRTQINWRGNVMRIGAGSRLMPLDSSGSPEEASSAA